MQTRSFSTILLLILLTAGLFRCANPISPEGGAKDISPPKVLECDPPNLTTHFTATAIHITFNEFVSLKSSGSEIFFSPPLADKPDYKLRGKTMIIDLNGALDSNTTYIISFGKSISDITEGNIMEDYRFVFSTGGYIDSLMISGEVVHAFDNTPAPNVFAELYVNSTDTVPFDSLPYLIPPRYITQTNDKGRFTFQNLRFDNYKLVVLDDQSGDFIYNMPAEKIAFADSLVHPWAAPANVPDTSRSDSTKVTDTVFRKRIVLRMFEEIDSTQELLKAGLLSKNHMQVIFKYPPRHPFVRPMNLDTAQPWCMEEYSLKRDTIDLFTILELPDTLILEVGDQSVMVDTITITTTKTNRGKSSKKSGEGEKPDQVTVSWNPDGTLNFYKNPLSVTFSYPISEYDFSRIKLICNGDTTTPPAKFTDPLQRRFIIEPPLKEETAYTLLIPDSVFISYNGMSHDTLIHSFRTFNPRNVGNLVVDLNIDNKPGSYILQLLADKGKIVEERHVVESGKIKFAFIVPGQYTIKAILDANRNQRWDTGDFLNKIQPERVYFFPKNIEIRGNWDVEEEWKL